MRQLAVSVLLVLGWTAVFAAQGPVISEFMAANDGTVQDEDRDFSDYIELYNPGSSPVSLQGWYLTDDPLFLTKWSFPAVTLGPGQYLLVFASGKNRRDPASELHTNFELLSTGEYLALVEPDGRTVAQAFDPYPAQAPDVSYGYPQDSERLVLVTESSNARVIVPEDGSAGTAWRLPDFDDSSWRAGKAAVGYERSSGYDSYFTTDLESEMYQKQTTAYIRIPFNVEDPDAVSTLKLSVMYDDGFAAFINGTLVASRNAPQNLTWSSTATALHDDSQAVQFEHFDIPARDVSLRAGKNVLAVHGLNERIQSSDFLIVLRLEAVLSGPIDFSRPLFMSSPTPGWANSEGYPSISPPPVFSQESGLYRDPITVEISSPDPQAEIRYNLGWSEPGPDSTLYTDPIRVDGSVMIRAKVFSPNAVPSATVTRSYSVLDASAAGFSSNLPVFVLNTFGRGIGPDNYLPGFAEVLVPEEGSGRARLLGPLHYAGIVGLKQRGSSSAGFPKKMYAMETWDEKGNDTSVPLLGLPAESDWVLYAPYSDKSLMRNALAYGWSNDIDRYAPRTRFCEVFLNTGTGRVSYSSHYVGVYVLIEKIKRDEDRVDITKLLPSQNSEPEITGGYLLKIDRLDPGDTGFSTSRGTRICYVDPKERYITPAQANWIRNYMNVFESALFGPNFSDPERGYAAYIDVDSWVDHFLLTELCKNIDGYRLSTFFYKDRGGKLTMGPIWDYNLSLGNADYLHGWVTSGWYLDENQDPNGWGKWWHRLFDDPEFEQRFIDRWQEVRRTKLTTEKLLARVDEYAALLQEAQARNFQRWQILGRRVWPNWYIAPTWEAELTWMKNWIRGRVAWIDSLYVPPPEFSRQGGPITEGFELTIQTKQGVIFYTLDGSDPRLRGGSVSPQAYVYRDPIRIDGNVRVTARARSGTRWSGITTAVFYTHVAPVVISEIMYHPPDPPAESPFDDNDFEFVELVNRGTEPVDMTGIHFTDGIVFTFPEGMVLMPGEYTVVVKNLEAFRTRYGDQVPIAGQYAGNLENRGETLALAGPVGEPILDLTYDDQWYPDTTDGQGHSLVAVDPWDLRDKWSDPESWKPSEEIYGSPGAADSGSGTLGGWQRSGDANQDGALDVSDAVAYLRLLFGGGSFALPCEGSSMSDGGNLFVFDFNGDETVDIADVVSLLDYLFGGGAEPAGGLECMRVPGCPHACRW